MQNGKVNYQRELEQVLEREKERVPTLFLHSCCAPCSSYVLEYLSQYFRITVFYYNPNIYPESEYERRVEEQQRLIDAMNLENREAAKVQDEPTEEGTEETRGSDHAVRHEIRFEAGHFDPQEFYQAVRGLEHIPEGGERCRACFRLRLHQAAQKAKELGYDYLTTTLTISPLKNASALNEIGAEEAARFGVRWLPSDFKKKNGYKRSTELSSKYGLYRQDYCGCVFSRQERERQKAENSSCQK